MATTKPLPDEGWKTLPHKVKPDLSKIRSGIKPKRAPMDFSKLDQAKVTPSPEGPATNTKRKLLLGAIKGV